MGSGGTNQPKSKKNEASSLRDQIQEGLSQGAAQAAEQASQEPVERLLKSHVNNYNSILMREYKCHKTVKALKITEVTDCCVLSGSIGVEVGPDYFINHAPKVGGYYVVYKDGYESYSPAKAFKEGYSPVA